MHVGKAMYHPSASVKIPTSVNKPVSQDLVDEVVRSIKNVNGYGSIEIYVQDHCVTQITVRNIKKTKHVISE